MNGKRACSAPGCTREAASRVNGIWYCNKHYLRMHNNGDLELHPRRRTTKLIHDGGNTATIVTANGELILIDRDDIDKAMRYSWCISKTGYAVANIGGHVTKMHRYLLDLSKGELVVDHINGNPLDNRRCNLRLCEPEENGRNLKKKKSRSGETGIRKTSHGRWNARIMIGRKEVHLGNYLTKEAAIEARQAAERQYFGEYAPSISRNGGINT